MTDPPPEHFDTKGVLTVPNVLTMLRIVGAVVLLWLAREGHQQAFIWLLIALVLTDWFDGKIAIIFHQRTVLGARLDSIADAILYGALIVSATWMLPDEMGSVIVWVVLTVASYALTCVVAYVRFGRLPSYHTRAAKICWFLIAIGAVTLFAGFSPWPARIAMAAVILTNLEATAISLVLLRWEADVPSIYHALQRRGKHAQ